MSLYCHSIKQEDQDKFDSLQVSSLVLGIFPMMMKDMAYFNSKNLQEAHYWQYSVTVRPAMWGVTRDTDLEWHLLSAPCQHHRSSKP